MYFNCGLQIADAGKHPRWLMMHKQRKGKGNTLAWKVMGYRKERVGGGIGAWPSGELLMPAHLETQRVGCWVELQGQDS